MPEVRLAVRFRNGVQVREILPMALIKNCENVSGARIPSDPRLQYPVFIIHILLWNEGMDFTSSSECNSCLLIIATIYFEASVSAEF